MGVWRRPAVGLGLLLAVQATLLVWEAWRLGFTYDEPSHLAAGYMYWTGNDVLYPSDAPPLTRIVSGWAARLTARPPDRAFDNAYEMGNALLQGERGYVQRVIFCSRLPFILFPLGLVLLVWRWSGRLFAERAALPLACCTAFEPTVLGHGALIKSDVPAAFGCVLFAYAAWLYWTRPCPRRLALLTGALVVAVLTKFSLLALVPVALIILVWRGPRVMGPAIALAALYLGIAAAYQFRFTPELRGPVEKPSPQAARGISIPVEAALLAIPFPAQFVRGILFIGRHDASGGFGAYMLGRRLSEPSVWYFPLAWALKFPIALQLGALAGLLVCCVRRPIQPESALVWGLALWLGLLACRSSIQIGFRHLLPMLPLLIVGAGFAIERWRPAAWVLPAWVAVASLWVYPNGLSYFNEWIGGPANGWKYLADSNLDWGQNLPDLMDLIDRRHLTQVRLAFATPDPVFRYANWSALVGESIPGQGWTGPERLALQPAVYAVGVNTLVGLGLPPRYRDYFAELRTRRPDARAGYGILIYSVASADRRAESNSPPGPPDASRAATGTRPAPDTDRAAGLR
jgi:hypothetical protein